MVIVLLRISEHAESNWSGILPDLDDVPRHGAVAASPISYRHPGTVISLDLASEATASSCGFHVLVPCCPHLQ